MNIIAIERPIMTLHQIRRSNRIARRAGKQGARAGVTDSALVFEKLDTDHRKQKPKLFRGKNVTSISTFNVRTLHTECKSAELVSSAIDNEVDIICIQEHRYFHKEINLNYTNLEAEWTLITAFSWKNASNSTIGETGMLHSHF